MKWHDHPTAVKSFAAAIGADRAVSRTDMTRAVVQTLARTPGRGVQNTLAQIMIEHNWVSRDRPYYELYPSVGEAFLKIDLAKIRCDQLHLPLPELMVRCPVGQELELSPRMKLRSILIGESNHPSDSSRGWLIAINDGTTMNVDQCGNKSVVIHTITGVKMVDGTSIAEHLKAGRDHPYCDDKIDHEAVDNAFRLIATLCLLKDDPDLISPLPLDADKEKYERTHDPKLLEKAARRGKRAWAVGRDIEVAPGFRRPHFAIRWMGKGRVDPRVRPIKGCLVRRKQIEEVPTDWLGPEDQEPNLVPNT